MTGKIAQWRERVARLNMLLFFGVGCALLWRGVVRHAAWPVYAMGTLFLVAGGLRLWLLRRAEGKPAPPGRP